MNEEKKSVDAQEVKELDLNDLEKVSGGSVRDVQFTKTKPISEDTKRKI